MPLIPTGSTPINLALSDTHRGGYMPGRMVNIIGDSSSGKSLLIFSCFAEMAYSSKWDEYELIYDDTEHALTFNVAKLFGRKTLERVRPPRTDKDGNPEYSHTVEDFYRNVMNALRGGKKRKKKKDDDAETPDAKPFVYVLDSLDAIGSEAEDERAEEYADGKEVGGSFKTEKPRLLGELLRQICEKLEASKSVLIIVSQTRDNLTPMSFEKKRRSGGNALRFFCTHEIWLANSKKEKKRERTIGGHSVVKCSKNKLTGKLRTVDISIFYDLGVDDVGNCVDFLVKEEHWKKPKASITAPEFDFQGTRDKLIRHIEDNNLEPKLRKITAQVWNEIEESLKLNRKPRFT